MNEIHEKLKRLLAKKVEGVMAAGSGAFAVAEYGTAKEACRTAGLGDAEIQAVIDSVVRAVIDSVVRKKRRGVEAKQAEECCAVSMKQQEVLNDVIRERDEARARLGEVGKAAAVAMHALHELLSSGVAVPEPGDNRGMAAFKRACAARDALREKGFLP